MNNNAPHLEDASPQKKTSIIKKTIFTFLMVNTVYWCSIQLLYTYCAPSGLKGFFTSLWTSQHPACRLVGTIHSSMDQMMFQWPGLLVGAVSFYIAGMLPLS